MGLTITHMHRATDLGSVGLPRVSAPDMLATSGIGIPESMLAPEMRLEVSLRDTCSICWYHEA